DHYHRKSDYNDSINDEAVKQLDCRYHKILRTVMQKFADIKQIRGDSREQVPDLLIVKKCKRQFLVVIKDFISHVMFYMRAHEMSEVGNIVIAEKFNYHKAKHQRSQLQDHIHGFAQLHLGDSLSDIAHQKRDGQSHSGSGDRAEHVREKQQLVRFVIARQLSQLVFFLFHSFLHFFSFTLL